MALFRNGKPADDEWTMLDTDSAVPSAGAVAVSKARWLAERETLVGRNAPLGLVLQSGENLDGLEADLSRFALIALHIPKYADGRLYSIARLLRDRHGFAGEIRARGDVLRDQIGFLYRAGFDALDVAHEGTIAALQAGTVVAVPHHYQPAAREDSEVHDTATSIARPWLRRSKPGAIPGAKS